MHEVSKGGRSVLFVSHNLAAVASLTTRAVVLNAGRVEFNGAPSGAIEHYTRLGGQAHHAGAGWGRGPHTALLSVRLLDSRGHAVRNYVPGDSLRLEVGLETDGSSGLSMEAFLMDGARQKLAMASLHHFHGITLPAAPGRYLTVLELPPLWLASGTYSFDLTTSLVNADWDHYVEDVLSFDVLASNPGGHSWDFKHSHGYGALALPCVCRPEFHVDGHAS
jgi:hypothetical protein